MLAIAGDPASLEVVARLHENAVAENSAGRPAAAVRIVHRALALAADRPASATLDVLRARLLITLALSEAELHGVDRGLVVLDQADELAASEQGQTLRGALCNQRGLMLLRAGRATEALAVFDASESWMDKATPLDRCTIWLNRSVIHLDRSRLSEARADLSRCAATARSHGIGTLEAKALYNLGYLEFLAGDLPLALQIMDSADQLDADVNWGVALLDRARVLIEAGLHREADEVLAEAGRIFRRDRLSQDAGEVDVARAECALLAGDPAAARRLAVQARRRFAKRGNESWRSKAERLVVAADVMRGRADARLVATALRLAAGLSIDGMLTEARTTAFLAVEALLDLGRTDEALAVAIETRPAGRTEPISARLHTRYLRARLRAASGRSADAAREVRAGLHHLAVYQGSFGSIDLQTASAVHGRRLAELGVSVALDTGRPARVLAAAELGRAVSSRLTPVRPPADDVAAGLLAELRQTVEDLRAAGSDRSLITRLTKRRRDLERRITARSWTVSGGGGVQEPASLGRIRASLAAHDSTLVSYVQAGDALHAVVVDARRIRLCALGAASTVDGLARRVRADLDALAHGRLPGGLRAAAAGSLRGSLAALDNLLLAPLGALPGRVVVVPTGVLATLPWGALQTLHGVPVTVAPSVTAWLPDGHDRPGVTQTVAVAGPDLERAADEVRAVAATWAGTRVVVDGNATRQAVVDATSTSTLLHIAAHGTHHTESPLFSSIRLADGVLFAHELDQSVRTPEHVILSACDLGLATVRAGDEALGLTSVLLHLGTRCVVSGVARVHDDVAAETMTRYHARLAAGRDSAEALAEVLVSAGDDAPAPFVCFGSPWTAPRSLAV